MNTTPTVEAAINEFENLYLQIEEVLERDVLDKYRNWLRTTLTSLTTAHEAEARKRFIEELFEIQTMGGKDEIHCTCLPYALVTLSGEEGSPESDAMEARLKALAALPQDPLPVTNNHEA